MDDRDDCLQVASILSPCDGCYYYYDDDDGDDDVDGDDDNDDDDDDDNDSEFDDNDNDDCLQLTHASWRCVPLELPVPGMR